MAQGKQGFGCNFQTCVNCLICYYICGQLCRPRRNSTVSMLAGFAEDASGDAKVNQALVPAATGGALGDLPLLACATMVRDEASGPDTAASYDSESERL